MLPDGLRTGVRYTSLTIDSIFSPMVRPFISEVLHGQVYATSTTRPATTPASSRLNESASLSVYPDSRPLYPNVYNPPISYLHSVLPQGHNSAISSAATHPTFIDDREGMRPLTALLIHTVAYPDEGEEQGIEVALKESLMGVDDAAVDDIMQSQSHPRLTTPYGLQAPLVATVQTVSASSERTPCFPPFWPRVRLP